MSLGLHLTTRTVKRAMTPIDHLIETGLSEVDCSEGEGTNGMGENSGLSVTRGGESVLNGVPY